MRIYLDSAPVIYLVEHVKPFATKVLAKIGMPGVSLVSSNLTRRETSIVPLRKGDSALLLNFDSFFAMQVSEMAPFTEAVFRNAADMRAVLNFKTSDALHLAAAIESRCDLFLTNDAQLLRCTKIPVEVIT